ncbi:hypothetical protein [Geobacter sp.]|uniref:hypothetical protein n=1 Tax=Geobacter sp. TaxID=46610 RepID=UPI001AC2972F|nr:hypothetical protein [Geobacter sp.]CAG0994056.1 hypothetical protein ANRL4_02650 [Anaerolineae bacterium]
MENVDILALLEERSRQARFHRRVLEAMPAAFERDEEMGQFASNLETAGLKRFHESQPKTQRQLKQEYLRDLNTLPRPAHIMHRRGF